MLKSIKYELRRNRTVFLVVAVIFALAECYFLYSNFAVDSNASAISMWVLAMIGVGMFFFVLINGTLMYSRELSRKSGYLTFMTPVSPTKIIISKLLTVLVVGTIIVLLLAGFAVLDLFLLSETYPEIGSFKEMLPRLIEMMGFDPNTVFAGLIVSFISLVISVFTIVSMAYVCITLSSTLFQNKSWKGIVSFVLFILLSILLTRIDALFPTISVSTGSYFWDAFVGALPSTIFFVVVIIADIIISGQLLEKKVCL